MSEFTLLGKSGVTEPTTLLETFERPQYVQTVLMESDEVTAVCPVTGQPDQYTATIAYNPRDLCIESKSLKLYLQSFRNKGLFCEDFSRVILQHVIDSVQPLWARVQVMQKPRGGVSIVSEALYDATDVA